MKKEEVEKSLVESLNKIYGDKEIEVVVDVGSNTWEEIKETESSK